MAKSKKTSHPIQRKLHFLGKGDSTQSAKKTFYLVKNPSMKEVDRNKIIQCFTNVDLRNGHDGLAELAKRSGVNVADLQPGQFVPFINPAKTRMKLFCANDIVLYYRAKSGQIDLRIISELPKIFKTTGRIDCDSALKTAIEKSLARRARARVLAIKAAEAAQAAGVAETSQAH
jgi:hypothetical protein